MVHTGTRVPFNTAATDNENGRNDSYNNHADTSSDSERDSEVTHIKFCILDTTVEDKPRCKVRWRTGTDKVRCQAGWEVNKREQEETKSDLLHHVAFYIPALNLSPTLSSIIFHSNKNQPTVLPVRLRHRSQYCRHDYTHDDYFSPSLSSLHNRHVLWVDVAAAYHQWTDKEVKKFGAGPTSC